MTGGLPRSVQLLGAAGALVLFSPLMLLAAVAVRVTSPGPVLFRQRRVGLGGQPFEILKFRTMRSEVGGAPTRGPMVTEAGDRRITTVGRWLRATKCDELPQLINVLRGEMDLVGPRPEVERYVDLDDPRWQEVLAMRPGITDPVAITLRDEEGVLRAARRNGENPEDFYRQQLLPKKLEGYLAYGRRRSGLTDLGTLLATLVAVLRPRRDLELSS